jgi:hypothetical protein
MKTIVWIVDRRTVRVLASEPTAKTRISACGRSKWARGLRLFSERPMHLSACSNCLAVLNGERPIDFAPSPLSEEPENSGAPPEGEGE